MTTLVTGASGFLGRRVLAELARDRAVVGTYGSTGRPGLVHLDLGDERAVTAVLDRARPTAVVHAAAVTDPDTCERRPDLAWAINAAATGTIAAWCRRTGARMLYISTDYVFDGRSGPYDEAAAPSPLSAYGESKLAGERATLEAAGGAVLRVAILYGFNADDDKPTVPTAVVARLRLEQEVRLDGRRVKYPTEIGDVARIVRGLLAGDARGIYHACNPEPMSRYEWGLATALAFQLDPGLVGRDDTV